MKAVKVKSGSADSNTKSGKSNPSQGSTNGLFHKKASDVTTGYKKVANTAMGSPTCSKMP